MTRIFVFGSNLAGRHGRGAALHAHVHCGARYGVGEGPTGHAYAIPTKDENLRTRPLAEIHQSVNRFIEYARAHPELTFRVTAIGTGLAGYRPEDIAPMFVDAPGNCDLPDEFMCRATHWFGVDPPGTHVRCTRVLGHTREHLDDVGRWWWETRPSPARGSR